PGGGSPGRPLPSLPRGLGGVIIAHYGQPSDGTTTMRITANLAALALKQLVSGACRAAGVEAGAGAVEGAVGFLLRRFLDHSSRLTEALARSNERAWRAVEVALAGDSLWDRCKLVLAPGEEKAFRDLVGPFLAGCSVAALVGREAFRKLALAELRAARKEGL